MVCGIFGGYILMIPLDESETTEDAFEGQNNLYKSMFEAFQKTEVIFYFLETCTQNPS